MHTMSHLLLAELGAAKLDLRLIFQGAPLIYSLLIVLSILTLAIWLYSLTTLRLSQMMPREFLDKIRDQLIEKRFEAALLTCQEDENFSATILATGISARRHGPQVMMETMQAEGKRCGIQLWHRISLLHDVVVIAPMLGLLGTVLGLFYAFYDTHRTAESLTAIFDGLGVAVGTTVAGLLVAIFAMICQTMLKYRVVRLLSTVENEVLSLGRMIDSQLQPA
jgi:biopolymer transport protein ExbB